MNDFQLKRFEFIQNMYYTNLKRHANDLMQVPTIYWLFLKKKKKIERTYINI